MLDDLLVRSGKTMLVWTLGLAVTACGGPPSESSTAAGGGSGGAGGGGGLPRWETLAPLPGGARQECAVVALDGKVYVIGGFDKAASIVADVEVYDPQAGVWTSAAPLPEPLHHANAAAFGGKIYVLGSLKGDLFAASGESHVYDPATNTWSAAGSLPAGRERGGAAVAVIGSHMYIAGGFRGGSVADVDRYDVDNDIWESLPPLPEARDHLVGAAVQGVFFAIGGRNGGITKLRDHVDRFDPAQGSWTPGAPMLTARGGAAAGVLGDRIHVVGGEGNVGDPSGVFGDNEAYAPAKDIWSSEPPMKTPKHGTGGAVVGGKLYVPGGAVVQAFGATDDAQVFVP
jgi:N-acetylneuraminic acid mutarotase